MAKFIMTLEDTPDGHIEYGWRLDPEVTDNTTDEELTMAQRCAGILLMRLAEITESPKPPRPRRKRTENNPFKRIK